MEVASYLPHVTNLITYTRKTAFILEIGLEGIMSGWQSLPLASNGATPHSSSSPYQGPTFWAALTTFAQVAVASWAPPGVVIDTKAVRRAESFITRHIEEPRHHSHAILSFSLQWSGLGSHGSRRERCQGRRDKPRHGLWLWSRHNLGFHQKFLISFFNSRKWFNLKPEKGIGSGWTQSTEMRLPCLWLMPNNWKYGHFWYFPHTWDIDGADSIDPSL